MQPLMFLHIGYPKTGTTGLQQFFVDNAERLRAHGILYPQTGRIGLAHYALNFSLGIGDYDKSAYRVESADVLRTSLLQEVKAADVPRSAGELGVLHYRQISGTGSRVLRRF